MYDRLISYIIQHKILFAYQFGFQKGKSTHMALIILVDKITEALDKGDYVIGVFLDFFKNIWHCWSFHSTGENVHLWHQGCSVRMV